MNVCACIGPIGDCPCIRTARGEKLKITETYISPEVFDLLSDEDKQTINELKVKALHKLLSNGISLPNMQTTSRDS